MKKLVMDQRQRTALTISVLSSFLTPFMGASINIALPNMAGDLSMSAVMVTWVATAYLLSAAILLVPFGKIADIYGRKKIFMGGMIIFTISSLMGAIAPTGWFMIASRIIQGIGSTMIFGTGIAIITSVFPLGERGKAIGINASSVYLGLSVGPFLGGLMTQHLGWRSIFWIMIPVGLVTIYLVAKKLKGEWADDKVKSFDWKGSSIYALALVLVMLGFSELGKKTGIVLLLAGIMMLFLFVRMEKTSQHPIVNINLFIQNRVFAFSNLAALINYSSTFAIVFILSLYLQSVKGFSAQLSGVILVAQPIIMTIVSPLSGRLSDRFEPRLLSSMGMAFCTIGLAIFIFLSSSTPVWFIIANQLLLGLGFGLFSSPNTNAIMSSVQKKDLGVASAMVGTMRLTGQMLSMGIAMLLMSIYIGQTKYSNLSQDHFMKVVKAGFTIFSLLSFTGIFASLARGKLTNNNT